MDLKKEGRLISGLRSRSRYQEIRDRILDAMAQVPMHSFVYESDPIFAYTGNLLSIGKGETISAQHMLATKCNLLDLQQGQKVLETVMPNWSVPVDIYN